jgi:PAS domain S-box-containing protein
MILPEIPQNEQERLEALRSYHILDTLSEEEFDELTELAAQICGTPIAAITLIDEHRQWFKSKFGFSNDETPRDVSFCAHAINTPLETMVVSDARLDERFADNPVVKGEAEFVFYAGVPIVDANEFAIGTLCVIDNTPRELSEPQIKSLKTIAKNVVKLIELRKSNRDLVGKYDLMVESLELNNPFYLVLDEYGRIDYFGRSFKKSIPALEKGMSFDSLFFFERSIPWSDFKDPKSRKNRMVFFNSVDSKQRYKCSITEIGGRLVISAMPLINMKFPLDSYHLSLNDFAQHDYIAEFLFLQNTSERSLNESRELMNKMVEKNKNLEAAKKDIDILSRFPLENPHPVLRLTINGDVLFCNEAAKRFFSDDFSIIDKHIQDEELNGLIHLLVEKKDKSRLKMFHRNKRHYSVTLRYVEEYGYVNLYANEITSFIEMVQSTENELIGMTKKLEEQKNFFENILNHIPSDIAVFDKNHKYLFVNPQGIKNPEIRAYMIGKDDFDYCKLKGIPNDLAIQRRDRYTKIIEGGEFVVWEDDLKLPDGTRNIIRRKMGPVYDENGEIRFLIGYGVDVTEKVLAEERYRSLFENNMAGVFRTGLNGEIYDINPAYARIHGYDSVEDLKNVRSTSFFKTNESRQEFLSLLKRDGSLRNHVLLNVDRYGNDLWLLINISYRLMPSGEEFLEGTLIDITEQKQAELSLQREMEEKLLAEKALNAKSLFQNLLMEISSKYINLPVNQTQNAINDSLKQIGQYVEVDRVYIFNYDYITQTTSNTYEWCNEGIEPQLEVLQDIPFSDIPIWIKTHSEGKRIIVPDVRELPHGKFRELIEVQDIQSLLALPLMDHDQCLGFVGFDSVRSIRRFTEDEQMLLQLYAQMLVNVKSRTEYIQQIETAKKQIEIINSELETRVIEETKKNLELAKSITDQEKLVTLGEIASGIAHDLNTPLGAIKSGAESIQYTFERLFNSTIEYCSDQQIHFAWSRAETKKVELFIGGMQQRREAKASFDYIRDNYTALSEEKQSEIAEGLVKARISIDETELIKKIVESDNAIHFINLIYHTSMIRNFINAISVSNERATKVIQGLRTFIKDHQHGVKGPVSLHQNISTVLSVFDYEIRRKTDLQFEVDRNLTIHAHDIKLFQLWSNIIKNGLESMEENQGRGLLHIYSAESNKSISISIANNGPMISKEIQARIFEKFYTTKAAKNGTGLGLNIVKNILDEHDAAISLDSNEQLTTFTITFKK